MKVPQVLISGYTCLIVVASSILTIFTVLSAHSAKGLSLTSYVLETAAYAITLAYSQRNGFPFSTYGENLFLTLQNCLITILIVYFPTSTLRGAPNNLSSAFTTLALILVSLIGLYTVPDSTLSLLQVSTLPLSVFSKLPQIMTNYRNRSTGQLSAFAVISQIAGCVARLFTTATEVGDNILFLGFAVALVLNIIVGAQLWMYWDSEKVDGGVALKDLEDKAHADAKGHYWPKQDNVEVVIPVQQSAQRVASPTPGRRWSRKID